MMIEVQTENTGTRSPAAQASWVDLPIYRTENRLLLASLVDGRPVWPVRSDDEEHILRRWVNGIGLTLREVSEGELRYEDENRGSSSLPGLVVAFGSAQASAARLYAHLTGRSWVLATGVPELPPIESIAVVLLAGESLRSDLLDRLYGTGNASAPGVLYGQCDEQLSRQVLLRAASARLSGSFARGYSKLSFSGSARRGTASEDARRAISGSLEAPSELLSVIVHSNGIDGALGPGIVACPIGIEGARDDRSALAPCFESGTCAQLGMPIADANSKGLLVSAAGIQARVMVWAVCWGVVDADGPIDRESSFVHKLATEASIGALLTTWAISWNADGAADVLTKALLAGDTVGTAAARVNALPEYRDTGSRLCIFGDPSLRTAARTSSKDDIVAVPELEAMDAGDSGEDRDESSLLEHCLNLDLRSRRKNTRVTAAKEAVEAAVVGIPSFGKLTALRAWLLQRARIYGVWSRGVPGTFAQGLCPCDGCRGTTIVGSFSTEFEPRIVVACSRCRFEADVPHGLFVSLEPRGGRELEIVGQLPDVGASAVGLSAWTLNPATGTTKSWPMDQHGKPLSRCALPKDLPRGAVNLTFAMVWEQSYFTLGRTIRNGAARIRLPSE